MLGVQTAQPYGSDLPRSVTAGEGGRGFSGVCFPCFSSLPLLPSAHWTLEGPSLEKGRCSGRAGPYQKSRGEGAEGVLAAPRAELLNPGHRLYSWLI